MSLTDLFAVANDLINLTKHFLPRICSRGIVFIGRPSVHGPSVTYSVWRDISVLSGGIL